LGDESSIEPKREGVETLLLKSEIALGETNYTDSINCFLPGS